MNKCINISFGKWHLKKNATKHPEILTRFSDFSDATSGKGREKFRGFSLY